MAIEYDAAVSNIYDLTNGNNECIYTKLQTHYSVLETIIKGKTSSLIQNLYTQTLFRTLFQSSEEITSTQVVWNGTSPSTFAKQEDIKVMRILTECIPGKEVI